MKIRSQVTTLSFTLLASATMLAGCSATSDVWDTLTRSKPQQANVSGERHAPINNPKFTPAEAPAPMAAPLRNAPKKPSSFDANPYDYYDDSGNRIEPKTETPAPKPQSDLQDQPQDAERGNFFTRFYDEHLKKPETASAPEVKADVQKTAAVTTAPKTNLQTAADEPAALGRHSPAAGKEETESSDLADAGNDVKSWFSRTWDKTVTTVSEPFEDEKPAVAAADEPTPLGTNFEKEKALPQPALSSVPPTPEAFQSVKAEREKKIEEMKVEHTLAAQEKAALNAEPSQQEAMPVELPKTEASAAPAEPAEAIVTPAAEAQPQQYEPVLLGHAATQENIAVPAAAQEEKEAAPQMPVAAEQPPAPTVRINKPKVVAEEPVSLPAPVVAETAPTPELPAPPAAPVIAEAAPEPETTAPQEEQQAQEETDPNRQPYWWEGWDVFSRKPASEQKQAMPKPAAATAPVAEPALKPAPVALQAEEAPDADAPTPLAVAPQPQHAPIAEESPAPLSPLPTLTPAAAPVAAVDAEEAPAEKEEAQETSSGLPSPAILNKVRMMPPSRYSDRLRSQQGY